MSVFRRAKQRKHERFLDSISLLVVFTFLVSFHKASFAPLASEYLKGFVGQDFKIAILEAVANLALIIINLAAVRIVLLFGKVRLMFLLFLILGCIDLVFLWSGSFFIAWPAYIVMLASFQLIWFCINLLVKRYSSKEHIHTNTSKVFAIANLSWVIGPALGGWLASNLGLQGLFAGMSGMAFLVLVIALLTRRTFDPLQPSKIKGSLDLREDLMTFFRSGFLRFHYLVYLALYAYYALMAIYYPLYLYEKGYSFTLVGLMISLSMLPFLLEYPVGKIADFIGNVHYFIPLGFLAIVCALILMTVIDNVILFVLAYSLGSMGASLVESLNESMVLKQIRHHKTAMLAIFSTSNIVGWLVGMVFCALVLYCVNLRYLFLLMSLGLVPVIFFAIKREEKF